MITLNEDELNFTVQQTLNRIIFLRIAEDKGMEAYGKMKSSLKGDHFYASLFTCFKKSDDKSDSGLYDLERDSSDATKLSLLLKYIEGETGWNSIKNGALLALMLQNGFEVLYRSIRIYHTSKTSSPIPLSFLFSSPLPIPILFYRHCVLRKTNTWRMRM